MTIIASIILILVTIYLLYGYIYNININTKKIVIIFSLIIIFITIFCMSQIPPESFDLYRYCAEMDYLRTLNLGEILHFAFSRANFIFYILEGMIAILFPYNNCIFVFTVPITVGIFGYLLVKMKNQFSLTNRQIILSIITFFSIIATIHLMSGIRNALAVSIYSLGIYFVMFCQKKYGYLFYVIALLIHPMVILIFIIQLLSTILFRSKIGHILCLCWSTIAKVLLYLLNLILLVVPIALLKLYTHKLGVELNGNFGFDYRIFIFELIQMIFITYIMTKAINKKEKKSKILPFYYLGYFIIGSSLLINIFIRTRFVFAYFFPFILGYCNQKNILSKKSEHFLLVLAIIINIYYAYYMYSNGAFI